MSDDSAKLDRLLSFLETNKAVATKAAIQEMYRPALSVAGPIRVGDDCAAIPDGNGFLLFAAEGMLESFVADDPWFAGYSAVMVNLSDVAAMGGRPTAIVNVLWTPRLADSSEVWEGMTAASKAYGVPIVGGHTSITGSGNAFLAAAVLGKAHKLITSFDARPSDDLLMVVDLRGSFRREKPFWNASVGAPAQRLRDDLELLPIIAERGWCRAGKDISNGGIIGTLNMLLQSSEVGAEIWLDRLPRPNGVGLDRWLIAFPSFGYLLSVAPEHTAETIALFTGAGIACDPVGKLSATQSLVLSYGSAREIFRL
jgi:AIR synthase-related protein